MHKPYSDKVGHQADFRVKYRFYSMEEEGRRTLPFQGIRCDFFYNHPDHNDKKNCVFIIWPEFEDEKENLILDTTKPVSVSGTARMWLIATERRDYHCQRIKIGMKCWFTEGLRRTAECEVIEILGLCTNPK